jgi:DMATS type aromatic prenyltransferase
MSACLTSSLLRSSTLGDMGVSALLRLCKATGRIELIDQAARVFDVMSRSWAGRSIGVPAWPSDLTDDATPFEFSLGFEQGRPDVRMLVEAQGALPTAHEQWKAGLALSHELASQFGASCDELSRLADLFTPASDSALHFGLWHGVTFRPAQQLPDFKAYLNPLVDGRTRAFQVVREALLRLELEESAAFMAEVERTCGGRAWPVYFCLDMERSEGSRAKVYVAHYDGTTQDAAGVLSRCTNLQPGDVEHWCRSIVGSETAFLERPLLSCFSFTRRDPRPCGTLHIPARCYVENDQVLFERVLGLLDDVTGEVYKSAVRALSTRPLERGRGFQTYVSLRRVKGLPRVTVYLAPEIYSFNGCLHRAENRTDSA